MPSQCTHSSDIIVVCKHVAEEHAEVEALLVADNGHTDFALCLSCGELKEPDENLFVSMCTDCGGAIGIPARMPTAGKWQVGKLQEPVN